jgi:NAD+ kinase
VAEAIRSADYGRADVEFVMGDADMDHGEIDYAVSIGGDGTFLLTSRTIMGRGIPLYGVNMGRLGFLASGEADLAVSDVRKIVEGNYKVFSRIPLSADIQSNGKMKMKVWAFNEIMIVKDFVSRPIALSTFLDGEKLYSFLADGIIIATPTGSTAYSLSAGGPIVHLDVEGFSIVPICAHSFSLRPMVVPGSAEVKIVLDSSDYGAILSGDGQNNAELSLGDEVHVTFETASRVDVIMLDGGSYLDALRNKLNWS